MATLKGYLASGSLTFKGGGGRDYHAVGGGNIDSTANGPACTPNQMSTISARRATRLKIMPVTEARRSIPDPEKKFFKLTDKGIIIATAPSVLLRLGINTIKLKVRKAHVLNQWTSMNVVIEPVKDAILNSTLRIIRGRPKWKISHHLARFSLPKESFRPIIETMSQAVPGVSAGLSVMSGY
ncbi:hypothetical protein LY78DRAFT_683921 [Colletotrichum sublineola]|nr:hypothetical protein LY78DRAFT_683921 [Colletotrichum sublineola]